MNFEEHKAQMMKLIDRVEQNDRTVFRLLKSVREFQITRDIRTAVRYVIIGFKNTATKVMDSYIDMMKQDEDNLELLVSYRKIQDCIEFYKQEYDTLTDMMKEYRCYTRCGHLLANLVFQEERPEQDMVDYRKLPWTLF